jgi:pRiA4b ORF-3-like protein
MRTQNTSIYQFKITLLGTEPAIWRRFQVSSNLSLAQFHGVIQAVMGWSDYHLHEFRIGQYRFGITDPGDDSLQKSGWRDETTARLVDVFGESVREAEYLYDFGDHWLHKLAFEIALQPEPAVPYPICVDGDFHCPPEDCGGPGGFYDMLKIIRNPNHEEYQETMEWLGRPFSPEAFSVYEVNQRLAGL